MSILPILVLFFSVFITPSLAWEKQLPLPSSEKKTNLTSEQLVQTVDSFNNYLGTYPPNINSEKEREQVYQQWSKTLEEVLALDNNKEQSLYLLSELYRQGHNMDVLDSGKKAVETVEKCLTLFPDSISCNTSGAYLYLSIDPKYAPKGEKCLLKLRELAKPRINIKAEQGFINAYIYQKRYDEAIKQIDYYITLAPTEKEKWVELRSALVSKQITIHSK